MKKIILIALAGLGICFADPVLGLWKSIDEKTNQPTAIWQLIKNEKGELEGSIVLSIGYSDDELCKECKDEYEGFKQKQRPLKLIGTPFIYKLKQKSLGVWSDGYIIDPKTGKLYSCQISFKAADGDKFQKDTLKLRGHIVGFSFLGRSQYWQKSRQTELESLRKNNDKAIKKRLEKQN